MISKTCKFSAFSLEFQKIFSITSTIFLTVGKNNFVNKIPLIDSLSFHRKKMLKEKNDTTQILANLAFHVTC